ncbi:hypothetical protein L7F22_006110 [Adiantum nelumboides]|nr:hypothetical protein [Adiantum nelumboides]
MHSTRKNGLITPGMQPALEAESVIGIEVRGVVEDILMAKSSAVKSPRQLLTLRRLLHSSLSAKASPSVDTKDEASDEAVADAMKATAPPEGKKPTPKRKKLTPKKLDDVLVVHDDVHTDVDRAKLEKGTLPTPTTVESGTDAIVDAMVVDACTNAIADAMVVDACTDAIADAIVVDACTNDIVDAIEVDASTNATADGNVNDGGTESIVRAIIDAILDVVEAMVDACTNDIVDAMEVDASIDATIDGNVNDGGTKSIFHAIIDALLDAVEAMGTDAMVEDTRGMGEEVLTEREAGTCESMTEEVLIEREYGTHEVVSPSDVTMQIEVVCPSDATVEDTKGRGEEVLIEREARTHEAVGASDVTAQAKVVCPSNAAYDIVGVEEAKGTDATVEDMRGLAEAGDRAVQLREAMGEAIVAATNMKEANTHNTTEACIEQNNEAGKGTEVPIDRVAQSGEAMGEDTNEAGTKNANKEAKKGHECEGQERLKCLVVMPVQIVALPLASCEKKREGTIYCIILDVNGLLIRRYKGLLSQRNSETQYS